MGQRGYPPLTLNEVIAIVQALGFALKRQRGSHAHFERMPTQSDPQRRIVTVDMAIKEFDEFLIKSMIRQAGSDRRAFYGATPATAKKI